ncbi:helix-turn-helix domain-containing protein [Thiolapillus sp.]
MKAIHIIRTRYICNFQRVLEAMEYPIEDFLKYARVPAPLLDDPNMVISIVSMGRFLDIAVRETGRHDLAFLAGDLPLDHYGHAGRKVLEASNLFRAMQMLSITGKSETSVSNFFLSHGDGHAWFCFGPLGGSAVQRQQIELYRVRVILVLLQTALGTDWMPEVVRLRYTDPASVANNPLLASLNIEFDAGLTGVALPLEALATPMPPVPWDIQRNDMEGLPVDPLTVDSLTAFRRLLVSYLPFRPNVEMMADVTGISRRTIQRFLQDNDLNFSALLDQVVFNQAVSWLSDSDMAITEIAYRLGYGDVAHFSRSFRRLTGLAPSKYRQQLQASCR